MTATPNPVRSVWWNLGISAYWFASSFKWFILLYGLLAARVAEIVPDGEKNSAWGLVVAIGAAEAMIGPIIFGFWSDRIRNRWGRRRPFLAVGAAMTAIALMVLSNAPTLPIMIVAYLLLQISDDVATAPYAALIPDLVPEQDRGRASGVMALLQQGAQLVAAVTGLILGANPVLLFTIIAVLNLIAAGVTLATAKEPPSEGIDDGKLPSLGEWIAPWRLPDFRWVWITRFINSVGFYAILLYLLNYLTDTVKVFKLGPLDLGEPFYAQMALALLISLVAGVSAIMAGRAADRIGRKLVIRRAGVLMFVALIPFALVPNYTVIFAVAVAFAIGYGAYLSADWALVSDILPSRADFARDMGMWSMSVPLGQSLSGWMGRGIDALNASRAGMGYTVAFLFAACCFLASTELVRRIKGST